MEPETDVGDSARPFTTADLDYDLPGELIAQVPLPERDASRLLVVDRATGTVRDSAIRRLPEFLRPGDLLVLNDTKVLPAKFTARRSTGGKVGGLFLTEESPGVWRVLLEGSRRLHTGERLSVDARNSEPIALTLRERCGAGEWRVVVDPVGHAEEVLARVGAIPLPPYIGRDPLDVETDRLDRRRYQTVYARRPGAVAAPTAGLHLTEALLDTCGANGVETAFITLHVGPGTFQPIRVHDVSRHVMHAERIELREEVQEAVCRCRRRGGRVIAVGTTSVRVLESAADGADTQAGVRALSAMTDLFIYPPRSCRVVDCLLTNFHLPRSTLLALVMAVAGVDLTQRAYRHAIAERYRFYSYGDAMLIL